MQLPKSWIRHLCNSWMQVAMSSKVGLNCIGCGKLFPCPYSLKTDLSIQICISLPQRVPCQHCWPFSPKIHRLPAGIKNSLVLCLNHGIREVLELGYLVTHIHIQYIFVITRILYNYHISKNGSPTINHLHKY